MKAIERRHDAQYVFKAAHVNVPILNYWPGVAARF